MNRGSRTSLPSTSLVAAEDHIHALMITCEWPTTISPDSGSFIARQVKFLRQAGVEIDVFDFRGRKNPRNYIRAWRAAQHRLSRGSYDVVHAQWGQSALLAFPKRLPLVVTFRGSDLNGDFGKNGRITAAGRVLRVLSRWVADRADQIIVVSKELASRIPGRPCHVIPSGLDLDLFHPMPLEQARSRLGLPIGKPLVLFAAGPCNRPIKRYALAEAAMARLSPRLEAELVVASVVPHVLMPCYMNACDVLLVTSIREGSPNVVKEALACNLPVVSVDVGDVKQRIGPVEGCVLCRDDSPETIAADLERILQTRERVDGRRAVADLAEGDLAKRTIAVYREAIASSV